MSKRKSNGLLNSLLGAITGGGVRVVDLTMTLDQKVPTIVLPPELGQSWPFRLEEISRYDHRGPNTYWNNMSCGEHTGTHFLMRRFIGFQAKTCPITPRIPFRRKCSWPMPVLWTVPWRQKRIPTIFSRSRK